MDTQKIIDDALDAEQIAASKKRWETSKSVVPMLTISMVLFGISYLLYQVMLDQQAALVKAIWESKSPIQLALSDTSPRYFYASVLLAILGVCALLACAHRTTRCNADD